MPKAYPTFVHNDGNIVVAVDVETTGTDPGWHEVVQVAVVPLDGNLDPLNGVSPFYMNMAPQFPERAEPDAMRTNGLNLTKLREEELHPARVADLFDDWFARLELPFRKKLMPLAHNWAFESGMLKNWLGCAAFDKYFHPYVRDSMLYAVSLMDKSAMKGDELPFTSVALGSLARKYGVSLENAHDALADALAEAELYRHLLQVDVF